MTCHECGEVVDGIDDHADGCGVPDRIRARKREYVEDLSPEARDAWSIDGKILGVDVDDDGEESDDGDGA